jgi:RNA-directed DNA polymerase
MLANLYMNRFLKHWRQTGQGRKLDAKLVSYADDFVVLSRGHAPAAHQWVREVMTRLGLALNEQKTVIRDAEEEGFDFLGYHFGPHYMRTTGQRYMGASASKKSRKQLRARIKTILRPSNMQPWPEIRDDLNAVLRGWANYFSYGSKSCSFRTTNHYVWESVRQFLRRRHKVPSRRTHRFSYQEVYGELGVLLLEDACGAGPHARSTKPV